MASNYDDRNNRMSARDRSAGSGRSQRTAADRRTSSTRRSSQTQRRRTFARSTGSSSARESAREKKLVRKQIIISTVIVFVLFAVMTVYIVGYAARNNETLFDNDYNGRQEKLLAQNTRGRILADDGKSVLAESKSNADGTDTRIYPYSDLFAHVVGYTEKGGAGIELLNNYDLAHTNLTLSEKAGYDEAGEKYPADDVYTTLDTGLQQAASDALGNNNGAIIVTEVKTGRILCLVSKPSFDPGSILEDWDKLTQDSESGTLVNRATQGLYAPGSTFKIFDAVEFMKEDYSNALSYRFDCPGYFTKDNETINCFHWEVHGNIDLAESFAESCNSSFANIGTQLNRDSFISTLNDMLFGDVQGLYAGVPDGVSSSRFTLDATTDTKEVMQLAIGQGQTLMTPIHLNLVSAAIANGGTVYKPYVVDSVKTYSGKAVKTNSPSDYKTIMSSDIAAQMRKMMREVVSEGTGSRLSTRPYSPAGKTGSAEYQSGTTKSHAWFTGFAPIDDPEVAITVIVEGAGVGGTSAVPAARKVLDQYFGYTPAAGEDNEENYIYGTASSSTTSSSTTSAAMPKEDLPKNSITMNLDTNGDGILDAVDIDGDGRPDAYDTNGDGMVDTNIGASAPATSTTTPSDNQNNDTTANDGNQTGTENNAGGDNSNQGGNADNGNSNGNNEDQTQQDDNTTNPGDNNDQPQDVPEDWGEEQAQQ